MRNYREALKSTESYKIELIEPRTCFPAQGDTTRGFSTIPLSCAINPRTPIDALLVVGWVQIQSTESTVRSYTVDSVQHLASRSTADILDCQALLRKGIHTFAHFAYVGIGEGYVFVAMRSIDTNYAQAMYKYHGAFFEWIAMEQSGDFEDILARIV